MMETKYKDLQKEGYIIIHCEGGLVQDVWKPYKQDGKRISLWNGKVVILDFDVQDEASQFVITLKGKKRPCDIFYW